MMQGRMEETGKVTRRRLLGTAAAGVAAAALPDVEAAARNRRKHHRPHRADVVVVGAGFAGLTAALNVLEAGHSVIVLEARDRVGGRAWNHPVAGGEISERGCTFVGPTQDHILALASRFGVGTFPTYNTGNNVYVAEGQRSTWDSSGPTGTAPLDPLILPDLTLTVALLDQMAAEVPVDAPWTAAQATSYDRQTLDSWINSHTVTPRFRRLVPAATRSIFGAEPRELSLLFTLFYIAASGNEQNPGTFERNFNTAGGAQESRLHGGSQELAMRVAKRLGRRVRLNKAVKKIEHTKHKGVTIHVKHRKHAKHSSFHARQVIVAVPPTLAGRIHYAPRLPVARSQLTQRFPQGTMTKVTAVYQRPFWRDAGLTGTAVSDAGPVNVTFDDSPPGGTPGIVFGFVGGDAARSFNAMSAGARRQAVLDQFAFFFGAPARNPIDYFETNWSAEKWTRGCPVGILGPGTLTAYGEQIRKPVGRIHWAGTETSTYWNGYMDGAVRSGERAAAEVLAKL
jgi:monoamine oxidase